MGLQRFTKKVVQAVVKGLTLTLTPKPNPSKPKLWKLEKSKEKLVP